MKAQKVIQTEIEINAPVHVVFAILTENTKYVNWNPFIIESEGTVQIGNRLRNTLKNGDKTMTFKPRIKELEHNAKFSWIGHLILPGIFDGYHVFELEQISETKTRFVHYEQFSGLFSNLILKSIRENTTVGFNKMNTALKNIAEKKWKEDSPNFER